MKKSAAAPVAPPPPPTAPSQARARTAATFVGSARGDSSGGRTFGRRSLVNTSATGLRKKNTTQKKNLGGG